MMPTLDGAPSSAEELYEKQYQEKVVSEVPHDDISGLTNLGSLKNKVRYENPTRDMMEVFPNQFPQRFYTVSYIYKEMASLCPMTHQPDTAVVTIRYVPRAKIVETKSLKLYLMAYRNQPMFMETITNHILEDIVSVVEPYACTVDIMFGTRGGMDTHIVCEYDSENDSLVGDTTLQKNFAVYPEGCKGTTNEQIVNTNFTSCPHCSVECKSEGTD